MFLGKKETSLITVDIDTGAVVSVYDSNSCIWDERLQKKESSKEDPEDFDADLDFESDETSLTSPNVPLRSSTRSRITRREVVIGRTDYHLSVHVDGKGVIQTLTYSVYGPNNIDKDRQERWQTSPDGRYVQPLPDGRLFFFEKSTEGKTELSQWVLPFPKPMYVYLYSHRQGSKLSKGADELVSPYLTSSIRQLYLSRQLSSHNLLLPSSISFLIQSTEKNFLFLRNAPTLV